MVTLSDKKRYVSWLLNDIPLKEKHAYWVLTFLLNHERVLHRVVFVDKAEETPRGLILKDESFEGPGMLLRKGHETITDPNVIFQDVRQRQKETLYISVMVQPDVGQSVFERLIEANPFISLRDEELDGDMCQKVETFLTQYHKHQTLNKLLNSIDQALENGDEALFMQLSKEYQHIKKID